MIIIIIIIIIGLYSAFYVAISMRFTYLRISHRAYKYNQLFYHNRLLNILLNYNHCIINNCSKQIKFTITVQKSRI